ncbi:hypothetical protein PR202_ga24348 [Eleusine coracana subsp. coracana]|uniref:Uncharacterized protein n=1 Tax=Eleusine coracana subsp. coracana TaxID=191504 RepID=A0AAV5D838_ELECO|nr:hypothetical protein PR202_ga24348 [Eleusine coracana subsp. coracana]
MTGRRLTCRWLNAMATSFSAFGRRLRAGVTGRIDFGASVVLAARFRWTSEDTALTASPRPIALRPPGGDLVWRRKDAASALEPKSMVMGARTGAVTAGAATNSDGTVAAGGAETAKGVGRRRRRCVRQQQGKDCGGDGGFTGRQSPELVEGVAVSAAIADPADLARPSCVIDRSTKIARSEEEFRRALFGLVVGDLSAVLADVLADELYRRYELPNSMLEVHRLYLAEFLLVCQDVEVATRFYDEGNIVQLSTATLHFRQWSRFHKVTGAALPHLVDIELRGRIPHTWGLETMEHLLN